jgi:shikimate dehydrogenase
VTDRYAVIGNPISQSKSPLIHSLFAAATAQDLSYTTVLAPLEPAGAFADTVRGFRDSGGRGMNVTAPFKLLAFALADVHSERAQLAGAVNAMKFEAGRIHADNFDGVGLVNDIQRNLGFSIAGKRVLMLGAGGAARGALLPFLEQHPAEFVIANRTVATAQTLAQPLAARFAVRGGSYSDVGTKPFDLVLNATSASLKGELPPLSPALFAADGIAYELVYGKGLTPFLRLAQSAGVKRLADGVGMLVEQAAEAFVWWRGVRPATAEAIARLTVPLV